MDRVTEKWTDWGGAGIIRYTVAYTRPTDHQAVAEMIVRRLMRMSSKLEIVR